MATSPFINSLKQIITKLGTLVLNRDLAFSVGFNSKDNIDFSLKVANQHGFQNLEEDGNTIQKLLCFIFSAALVLAYDSDNFFKFVAFDSPFDGDKNVWQDNIYSALKALSEQGVQTIVTTIVDEIKNPINLDEIKRLYSRRLLSEKDKLLGDF